MNAQHAIEKVLQDFTKELLKVFSEAVVQAVSQVGSAGRAAALPGATSEAPAGPKRRGRKPSVKVAPKAARPEKSARSSKGARGGVVKSSPAEVNRLSERVVDLLRKSARNLAAREIMKGLGLRATDEGRFQYALNKLKEDNVVQQHGERRQARYGMGAAPKKRGRPRKVPAASTATDVSEAPVTEAATEAEALSED